MKWPTLCLALLAGLGWSAAARADASSPAVAHNTAGIERLQAGDPQGAAEALARALQADPNYAPSYYNLGLALLASGQTRLANRILESYIRLGADSLRVAKARRAIASTGAAPPPTPAQSLQASGYIGPQACGECHAEKLNGFVETAHYLTSQPATPATVNGAFKGEDALLLTRNRDLWFEMGRDADGLYQTANTWTEKGLDERRERFDLVIGSGKIGQSYLFWRGDRLFQLPVSHYSATDKWINSPGFRDGEAFFERTIIARCLECHATYFQSAGHADNIHGKNDQILGVTCERCHGPGAAHAQEHRQNDQTPDRDPIVHPGLLQRDQVLDLCGQCHSDTGPPLKDPFSFRPGAVLSDYYAPPAQDKLKSSGVHAANQVGRLKSSACYAGSPEMSCATCHDPHALERGDTRLFSQRCRECHAVEACDMSPELGQVALNNCIDCHMPRRRDTSTQVQSAHDLQSPLMPDHRIGVYPEATQRFMDTLSAGE